MTNTIASYGHHNIDSSFYTRENAERAMQFLENNNLKAIDADTFEQLKDLIDKVEVDPNSKIQGPLKTVLTAIALAGASGLTAAAVAGRGLGFLQKNTKIVDKFGKFLMEKMDSMAKALKKNSAFKKKSLKGAVLREIQNIISKAENFAKNGTKNITKEFKGKGSVAKRNTEQGKYLIDKGVRSVAAVGVGGKTLKETTMDSDKNGIADIHENAQKKSSSASSKLAEAIIAAAI